MKPTDDIVTIALEAWEESTARHTIVGHDRIGHRVLTVSDPIADGPAVPSAEGSVASMYFWHAHEATDYRRRLIVADMLEAVMMPTLPTDERQDTATAASRRGIPPPAPSAEPLAGERVIEQSEWPPGTFHQTVILADGSEIDRVLGAATAAGACGICGNVFKGESCSICGAAGPRETIAPKAPDAVELAYGLLWGTPVDTRTVSGFSVAEARKALLGLIDKAGQSRGITAARAAIANAADMSDHVRGNSEPETDT